MKKLNQRKIRWIVRQMKSGELSVCRIAKQQNITARHARRVFEKYKDDKRPRLLACGRKPRPSTTTEVHTVLKIRKQHPLGAVNIQAILDEAGLKFTSVKNGLDKLELIKTGKLINAAVIFFAHKPEKFFRNAKLRCAFFPTENTATILDRQEHEGDLLYLIEKAEEYILKNIHIGMKIEGLYRVDVPEIDPEAFREAIINAFCHRDYFDADSVDIAVFKDRVEIRSPGLLFGGLTIKQIKEKMVSARRNKIIAELFHRMHAIEKWGRGIRLILSKEPKTNFQEIGTHFTVTFKRKTSLEITPPLTPPSYPPIRVTELEAKILNLLAKNPRTSRTELANSLGIKIDTIKEYLQRLKKKGILTRKGGAQKGYWEVRQ